MLPLSESINWSTREKYYSVWTWLLRCSKYHYIDATSYIAGYVAQMAHKQLLCMHCYKALGSENYTASSSFIESKTGINFLRQHQCHQSLQRNWEISWENVDSYWGKSSTQQRHRRHNHLFPFWGPSTWQRFWELDNHMFESAVDENHVLGLIKVIAKCYCKARLYHLGKETTENLSGMKNRNKIGKLVLFYHQ